VQAVLAVEPVSSFLRPARDLGIPAEPIRDLTDFAVVVDEVGEPLAAVVESGPFGDGDSLRVLAEECRKGSAGLGLMVQLVLQQLVHQRAVDILHRAGVEGVVTAGEGERTGDQNDSKPRSHAPILPTRAKPNGPHVPRTMSLGWRLGNGETPRRGA